MSLPSTEVGSAPSARTVQAGGVSVHLLEAGSPADAPLLYLHGFLTSNLWLPCEQNLAGDHHVFAPDLPGWGLTARPENLVEVADYALFVRDLLDALGLQRAALVGQDLGAWIAAEAAIWSPDRVERLVLCGALGLRVKGAPIPDMFALPPWELVGTCFEDYDAATPLMPTDLSAEYMFSQYRQFSSLATLAWSPGYDPRLEERLSRIACPALVLWGGDDRLVPPAHAAAYQAAIPGAALVVLEGAGHMALMEQPDRWSAAVRSFLGSHRDEAL